MLTAAPAGRLMLRRQAAPAILLRSILISLPNSTAWLENLGEESVEMLVLVGRDAMTTGWVGVVDSHGCEFGHC
jgi:hypothetical protein